MMSLFWFALVVGGGLILLSLLGDIFGAEFGDAGEVDLGEVGSGGAGGVGGDAGDGVGAAVGGTWASIFSLRNLTYALFGFGLAGVVLHHFWQGARPTLVLSAAGVAGLLASWTSAVLLGYVRRTESGALAGDESFVGLPARITLPLVWPAAVGSGTGAGTSSEIGSGAGAGSSAEVGSAASLAAGEVVRSAPVALGKVEVERGGRAYELLARPFGVPKTDPAEWGAVVVVAIEDGVALVAPLELGEGRAG